MAAWEYFQGNDEGKRGVAVWHRRAGKDLFGINLVATKVFERVGMYWHLLPTYKQGRAIVWNGFTRTGRRFIDHFPKEVVEDKNSTEMRIKFINGSMYQVVGTDNVDNLVGTNPVGCIFSEYSLQDPAAWDYIRPILAENGGWALFIYTARGKNHGYKMLNMARGNPKWFHEVLVAGDNGTRREDGTPVISDAMIEDERQSGMSEEMIQQEFYCSFEAPLVGAYYGKQMADADKQRRIMRVPHDPLLPVHTAWDLGMDDSTSIWFLQEYGLEVRVIDYYEMSGEGLAHYAKVLRGQVENGEHRAEYLYGRHYGPHDIEVRELGTGRSRFEVAKDLGIRFTVVQKHEVEDGIEAVRNLIPLMYFDEERADRGIQALRTYRKDFDEKNKIFRPVPVHDWSSHAADAIRIYAMGRRRRDKNAGQRRQERAEDNHDYLRT